MKKMWGVYCVETDSWCIGDHATIRNKAATFPFSTKAVAENEKLLYEKYSALTYKVSDNGGDE